MSYDLDLKGRRVLVTGGTKGLGAAIVEVLHEAGARIRSRERSGERPLAGPSEI